MATIPIILDCDPGHDDALAIALALNAEVGLSIDRVRLMDLVIDALGRFA